MKINCPYCNGDAVKRGKRKTKHEIKQLYFCKSCRKRWAENKRKPDITLFSLSCYNKGLTVGEIVNLIEKKFKIKASKTSVHRWIKELSGLCDYHMLRNSILERFGKNIITTKVLKHQGVIYHFRYHKGKLALLNGYESLANYLENFVYGYPKEFFEFDANRCSKVDIEAFARKDEKENPVCKITGLVLKTVEENSKRHKAVEEFMLINDTATVAVEVPVWLWEKSVGGITGHIDILQVRDGKIYVLDFKPDEIKDRKVMSQLYLYALGLSFRTKIPLENFRCAWFNDKVYYEFEPSKAITRDYWKKAFGDREDSEKKFVARQERTDALTAKYTDDPTHLVILSTTDAVAVRSDNDSSGYNNHGTLTSFDFNATSGWTDGKYGKALRFDGLDSSTEDKKDE